MNSTEYYKHAIDILGNIESVNQKEFLVVIARQNPKAFVQAYDVVRPESRKKAEEEKIYHEIYNHTYDGDNKIQCIKKYRELTGKDLKSAKEWVEDRFAFRK